MRRTYWKCAAWALPALLVTPTAQAKEPSPEIRLYTLDCGRIAITDMTAFDDSGHYDGKSGVLADPCFLIRHPKGDLLWDSGIGDDVATAKDGKDLLPGYRATVSVTLSAQLKQLGLGFGDIEYFAFSHAHVDHLGNANALSKATWLVNPLDLAWMDSNQDPTKALVSSRQAARTRLVSGDFDVFGDGRVTILQTPGHTPGHQSLMVRLPHHGPVLLSGDLWHSRENYDAARVPRFNTSRAETRASMGRIEGLIRQSGARLIIQHDCADIEQLPKVPQFLN